MPPAPMARILLVDDSSTYRVMLRKFLGEAGHEIVGEALDGSSGVDLACSTHPDAIVMDIVMPGVDGLEATRWIMSRAPTRILILSGTSTSTQRGTLDAIRAGAMDFLQKPQSNEMLEVREELLRRIDVMLGARKPGFNRPFPTPPRRPIPPRPGRSWSIVVFGVSTGGPQILPQILRQLPHDFEAPIVVAQHMPRGWTTALAAQLSEICQMPAREVMHRERLQAGTIYVAPGDFDVVVTPDWTAKIIPAPTGVHPSVDRLME